MFLRFKQFELLGLTALSFVTFSTISFVFFSVNEKESGGVSIVSRTRDLKRRRAMERHGQLSSLDESHRLLLEAEDVLYNDRSDLDLLAAFYKDRDEQDRRLTADTEDRTSSARTASATKSGVYDVIIVGAGWCGISAAMTLKAKGITNFIVLEAKDHIGGRSYTTNESFNGQSIPIDNGSMWIHGGTSNPLYPILTTVGGIPTSESTYPERMYKSNGGGAYTNYQLNTYYDTLYENGFFAYQERRQDSTDVDETLQSTANKYLSTVSSTEGKTIAKYFMRSSIEFEYAGSMSDMSLWWWDMDLLTGNGDDIFLPQGYSPLIEGYAAPVQTKIITEAVVTKVNYRLATSKVTYTKNGTSTTLSGRHVIVTVPLGVLQANSISFVPQLPASKRRSINNIGMGKMNKIFMFWNPSDVFWPSGIELFGDVVDRDVDFQFVNPGLHNGGKPILFAFFKGEYAESIESQSNFEDEISARAMAALRNMFGNSIPNPEKVFITRWNVDPYTRGAYSYNRIGGRRTERINLGGPIKKKRLFLSGEATNFRYFQTTHGAYLSGKATALRVMKSLRRKKRDQMTA